MKVKRITSIIVALFIVIGIIANPAKSIAKNTDDYTEQEKYDNDEHIFYIVYDALFRATIGYKYNSKKVMYIEYLIDSDTIKITSTRINGYKSNKAKKHAKKILKKILKCTKCKTKTQFYNKTVKKLLGNTRKGYGIKISVILQKGKSPSLYVHSNNLADTLNDYVS